MKKLALALVQEKFLPFDETKATKGVIKHIKLGIKEKASTHQLKIFLQYFFGRYRMFSHELNTTLTLFDPDIHTASGVHDKDSLKKIRKCLIHTKTKISSFGK